VAIRLLLDENLSESLLRPIAEFFPGSEHIRNLTDTGASDRHVWDLARAGGFVLTTREEDLVGMSVLQEAPPKVVWLNVGKSRNAVIAALLQTHAADIERFVEHLEYTFLAIGFYTAATLLTHASDAGRFEGAAVLVPQAR
jgi:predicted nuclease of predicted toxin-antitoxin system